MWQDKHILNSEHSVSNDYRKELFDVIEELSKKLSHSELKVLKTKLGLIGKDRTVESYIQAATETTVVRYFLKKFPETFRYEPRVNLVNEKNIECQILVNGNAFNIEVKTPSYSSEAEDKIGIHLSATGRFENFDEIYSSLKMIYEPGELNISKRLDNKLMDFLKSANSKFPKNYPVKHLNILVVACGDADDFQNFDNYIEDEKGFFTSNSYIDHKHFERVDCIVLSNLYYKHSPKFNKMTKESWDFSQAFNIIYPNPFRKNRESELLNKLYLMIPNYTIEYRKFHKEWIQKNGIPFYILKRFVYKELGEKQRKTIF
ncbi:hypothetical protein NUH30_18845 [Leptospira sp. 85282-16]|uniref:hypothetical protein n=1 Tax=Leptospira sp. 85282-16 TaxID=2971256 RepID=UPI0021C041CD|nr:hypothetical protein [Leptospira sp. 85282-16]MCT8335751.1 hypothetical protein [Leptospira sp. 85282-16]